jgi:hypothetical protein
MAQLGVYEGYDKLFQDEQSLEALRAQGDALTPAELEEKLELFQRLGTTGRRYTDIRITNTASPPAPPEPHDASADQRQLEDRFWDLRQRQFDLPAQEQRELHDLYRRFGDQPERYARGVTLHVGR